MSSNIREVLWAVGRAVVAAQNGKNFDSHIALWQAYEHVNRAFDEVGKIEDENALLRKLVDGPKA